MRALVAMIALAGAALLMRSTALSVLAARGVVIDVLAFAAVVWALRYGERWGSTFGFLLGLAADLDAAHWLGRHALVLSLLGYVSGRLGRALVRDNPLTQFMMLFGATLAHQTWVLGFELGGMVSTRYLFERVALAAVSTAPLGVLLLWLLKRGSGQSVFTDAPGLGGPGR